MFASPASLSDNPPMKPPWEVLRQVTVYDDPWVRVCRADVRLPDGSVIEGHHLVDVPRAAVGVVPVGDDGRILLIEHYRFINRTTGWEIPAGYMDDGETIQSAGARELLEETGHTAAAIQYLGHYHPSIGLSTQVFHLCVGRGLVRQGEIQDKNEVVRSAWFTRQEVSQMVRDNQILDGLSLTALLWFFFQSEGNPAEP